MKNKMLLYTVIICLLSLNSWTQKKLISLNEKKPKESNTDYKTSNDKTNNTIKKIKYYHVEEIHPMKFGGYITEYDVTNPKLIRTYDLGPNNKRTITPVYTDEQQIVHEEPTLKSDTLKKIESSRKIITSDAPKRTDSYAYIDVIKTYERVSDKGYESIDMLKKVGNSYFFSDEFEKAEKCYSKLFNLTTDLEPEYYYRYSIALKAMGKPEKADEFLKKFNQLSSNKSRQ